LNGTSTRIERRRKEENRTRTRIERRREEEKRSVFYYILFS